MAVQFYCAGKIWHAPKFRMLRDTIGMPVCSRWIDLESDSYIVQHQKGELWQQCLEDVAKASFVLLYSEDMAEEQRGALVEIGMAYGMGKPVYAVGRCKSIHPNEISDVAFTHHRLWKWLDTDNLVKGAYYAAADYIGCKGGTFQQKVA